MVKQGMCGGESSLSAACGFLTVACARPLLTLRGKTGKPQEVIKSGKHLRLATFYLPSGVEHEAAATFTSRCMPYVSSNHAADDLFRLQRHDAAGSGGARRRCCRFWARSGAIPPACITSAGRRGRLLDDARDRAANFLGCKPSEIIFTSGGTESNNLAIFGAARLLKPKGRHLITSAIEHHAVLHCFDYLEKKEGFEVTRLPVDSEGRVSVEDLKQAIRPDTVLVSIMAANNEIGTIQPVAELGASAASAELFSTPTPSNGLARNLLKTSASSTRTWFRSAPTNFTGPKARACFSCKSPLHPDPILFGGGHENERRAGTENLAGIIGLVEAMERFHRQPVFEQESPGSLVSPD